MKAVKLVVAITVAVVALAFYSSCCSAQQVTGELGSPRRHHHHQRKTASAARSEVRRGDQGKGLGVEGLVAAARRAAEGRAQRAAHHDRRRRLRRAGHLRRRHPDPGPGSHREERAALHEFPLHVALLTDAGGDHHRTQPSLGGLRGGRRNSDGVPGLRLDHPDREGHHRHHPEGRTGTRPRGSARTTTRRSSRTARPGRSINGRTGWDSIISTASSAATPASGSRTCSAIRRRSIPSRAIRAGT